MEWTCKRQCWGVTYHYGQYGHFTSTMLIWSTKGFWFVSLSWLLFVCSCFRSSGEGGGVITCSIYVVWILDERLSSKWVLVINNLVFYAQSTITVISVRSKWALSPSQWQLYNSTNLCFWVDPLRSSRLRLWMSDCSFTQRVLNAHRRNITVLFSCFMAGPMCCLVGSWLVPCTL